VPRIGRNVLVNAALTVVAVLLLLLMDRVTGRVAANEGRGYDGVDYSNMLNGWDHGTVNTALRPLIVRINRPVYRILKEPVSAFRAMNFVYIGLLCAPCVCSSTVTRTMSLPSRFSFSTCLRRLPSPSMSLSILC
jgi:hypothetical protein